MLSLQRTEGKIALVLTTLVVLLVYNSYNRPNRSRQQQAYDRWLVETETEIRADLRAEKDPALLEIVLRLPGATPGAELVERKVELKSSQDALRVIRLLQLVREANAFSRGVDARGSPLTEIEIRAADESFSGRLNAEELKQNIQAQTFLTLFDLYATEQTAKINVAKTEGVDETKSQ